jgi:ABC-type multidrug transport system fused ATPase/permease subunit
VTDVFRKIHDLLGPRERRQFQWLVILIILMGLSNMLGVASVLPFLAVIANPDAIEGNRLLSWLYGASGVTETSDFLIVLGVLVFLVMVLTTLIRIIGFYAMTRFTKMRTLSLSTALMTHYLGHSYVWFLSRHTADLGKTILSEVSQVVNGPVEAALRLLANAVMVGFLVVFLFLIDPVAAVGAALLFGVSYGVIFLMARQKLTRMGKQRVESNRQRFQIMQEAMGGIKSVKLRNLERSYIDRFQEPAAKVARNDASLAIISELPRHLLEVIAFGGMILFVLWLLATREGMIADVIPVLGVYAFAAARMFPTIQQLFVAVSTLRFGRPALDALHAELTDQPSRDVTQGAELPAIPLRNSLQLDRVSFAFPGTDRRALKELSLTIKAYTTVGIVGSTGAGKTTAVDLILGLLQAQSGELKVDGLVIDERNVRAWQKSVGYVPQDIFLVDDSVAANIAFGVLPEDIDMERVEAAAKVAELHDFVVEQLPKGYGTPVGERGTRLSGGQRQRIGIARAVYNNPDVLIFDEATSALDNLTERAVMDAVKTLGKTKTIIMIAHRLSTVQNCDTIYLMEHGRLVAADHYEMLVKQSDQFRALHEATKI